MEIGKKMFLPLLLPIIFSVGAFGSSAGELYRGKHLGRLYGRQHNVDGEVYAVDAKTLHIRGFTYDGSGPDAFFWTGFTEYSSPQGIIVPNEKGSKGVLGAYKNQDITITLPDGLTLRDIKWFAVWCRAYEVNFGDFYIPPDVEFPQPHVIGSLSGQHGIQSGPIVVVDAQTILVPDFSFDGQTPDVHFWVGKGKPGPEGTRVTDETGGETALAKADKKTMVLALPGDLTVFDIDYFGVWNRMYYVDFAHVKIPQNINVPPSLRMLGVTPQTKLNCEVLYDRLALEVRWAIAGESIVMQLVGRIDDGHYISFGLSGDESRSVMVGGDVVLAWFDRLTGRGNVVDYFIESKAQCSGRSGVCPDARLKAEANNVRLLSGAVVNDFTMLTFQRPLAAHDELDRAIRTNGSEAVIWAVGPLNQRKEASYHSLRNRDDIFIDFGRSPKWNCPAPETDLSPLPSTTLPPPFEPAKTHLVAEERPSSGQVQIPDSRLPPPPPAWRVPPILCHEPDDHVFYAQMGPTGGKRGYSAITGKVGWGIAWYINGLLVPEVYLVRGKTYTFVVEGGDNPESPAKYHPFYITDDPEGGFLHKSPNDKRNVKVFAGLGGTGTGRLCQWQETGNQAADSFPSYGAYQRSLSLQCDDGHPGILHWTPDASTPDTVYYQCYTHRYLGWKIHIVDSCEGGSDASFPPSQQLQSRRGEELPTPPFRRENIKLNETTTAHPTGSYVKPPEHQHTTHYQRVHVQEPHQPQPQSQQHISRPQPQQQQQLSHYAPNPNVVNNYQRPTAPPLSYPSPSPAPQNPYTLRPFSQTRAPVMTYPHPLVTYDPQIQLGSENVKYVVPPAVAGGPWSSQPSRNLAKRERQGQVTGADNIPREGGILRKDDKVGRQISETNEDLFHQELDNAKAHNKLHILTDIWSNIKSNQNEVKPSCDLDADCPSAHVCLKKVCRDPCPGLCGRNARCSVMNHVPMCRCNHGYQGNPFNACEPTKGL